MKKSIFFSICIGILFSFSGCSFQDIVKQYLPIEYNSAEIKTDTDTETLQRVYMDKFTGTLIDFTGDHITLRSGETDYTFDVSHSTLECKNGIISGDEISLIYEGQFQDDDVSSLNVLKVVDEYHKKEELENRSGRGMVQSLTPNTITITTKKGNTVTFPTTGTKQYYQNGISKGNWVYISFKGTYVNNNPDTPHILNGSQMKVFSISDVDPLKVTKIEKTEEDKTLSVIIRDIQDNQLTVSPANSDEILTLDLTEISSYFPGGIAPGSKATILYQGDFDGSSLSNMIIRRVTGQNPAKTKKSKISSTVSGTIQASTTNTITIHTADNALITCYITDADNLTSNGFTIGNTIKITFDPSASSTSTIYTALKIEDV